MRPPGSADLEQPTRISGWGIVFGAYSDHGKAKAALKSAQTALGSLAERRAPGHHSEKPTEETEQFRAMLVGFDSRVLAALQGSLGQELLLPGPQPAALANPHSDWR